MDDCSGPAPQSRRRDQRGYIMVMLLAFITAMGMMLTVAMPGVKAEVQREQEEELIFRGESIARAIAAYKTRTGTYPLKLDDLTKIRPRLLRKLYLDPMTNRENKEGQWETITAVQPGPSGDKTGLPIVGVHSRCQKDSFHTYLGKTLISDWAFSGADNLLGVAGSGGQNATSAAGLATAASVLGGLSGQTSGSTAGSTSGSLPTTNGNK